MFETFLTPIPRETLHEFTISASRGLSALAELLVLYLYTGFTDLEGIWIGSEEITVM